MSFRDFLYEFLFDRPLVKRLMGQSVVLEEEEELRELPPPLRKLAEKYREGLARALGVPPNEINPEIVLKWVKDWARAFIKPQYWKRYGLAAMLMPAEEEIDKIADELVRDTLEFLKKFNNQSSGSS